ncbi:MAG: glycosyltransferase family 39 protein [Chloroflexi bacterium]|nr:glycosyltransferase family 39 protein [Chloroflexota bacterium]MCI0576114.1 glycosyltransferase family 39 protein [Chloroflexota bacterium]MCI0647902.1 glycosyltransferase family 39 protein [Chloroflexota bacterium]MCI0727153.1 glycosyltransferase family 39 protein [Chloroflexota bacterium]
MSDEVRREGVVVGLLVVIMVVKGVLWSLAFPLWQGPDEDDHYAVIQFIGENGRLPDEGDVYLPDEVALSRALADVGRLPYEPEQRQGFSRTAVGPNEAEFATLPPSLRTSVELQATGKLMHATPLYYLLAAGVYRLFGQGDLLARVQAQRLLAVLASSPLVVVAYLMARVLFPADAAMRLTVPTLVAFHPMISEIAAVVSVDGFFFVCYSLLIYFSLLVFRDGFNRRYGLAMGAIFAVGMLTKPTLNGYAPLMALLVAYDWWRRKEQRREIVAAAVLMGLVIALPLGWWMQRSWQLNGDLFYFNPVVKGHRILQNPYYDYRFWPHLLDYYQSVWGGIFVTWWGHFGWLDTALPPWVYHLLRLLTLLAMAGLAYRLLRLKRRPPANDRWREGEGVAPPVVWGFLALAMVTPVVLLQFYDLTFWWDYGGGRGLQGRYWLGTVVPMLTFLALGLLLWLPPRWRPAGHMALRLGMVLLNVASLVGTILPRYYL